MDESPNQDLQKKPSLNYEETPILEPVAEDSVPTNPRAFSPENDDRESVIPEATRLFNEKDSTVAAPPKTTIPEHPAASNRSKKGTRHIGTLLFVVLLFGLGIWLSSQIRSFFAPLPSDEVVVPTSYPTPVGESVTAPSASVSGTPGVAQWQTMEIISGATKKAIPGVSYQLPGTVKAPTCDSSGCSSQGTNLPGGTRFTVAPRGKGQLLPDFRGAILTDASGREFTMKQVVFGSTYAYEYSGNFTGRTGGGYTFTAIRGVLMPVSETLAIEFNHFSPAGIITNFSTDDALFNEIIGSFKGAAVGVPTPTISLPATTPSATRSAF